MCYVYVVKCVCVRAMYVLCMCNVKCVFVCLLCMCYVCVMLSVCVYVCLYVSC